MTTFKPQTRQQQIDALEKDWAENPRWDGVTRPYTAEEVINLRGSFAPENTIAQKGADRLWELVNGSSKKGYVNCLGALTGGQAVQQAKAGIEAIYLSGWQVAADNNTASTMYPDQSLYPVDSVPSVVKRINNAFRRADQIQWSTGTTPEEGIDYFLPIVADAEAGFGGVLNGYELMRNMIESGAAGVHFEDQLASVKKCGHMGGKVLVPTQEAVQKLVAARLAADVAGTTTLVIARTDANAADLLTSDCDPYDQEFIEGERSAEGFYKVTAGIDQAISRGLAYSPYADLVWCETATPCLEEARKFAEAIHAKYPDQLLAYNCSPSFNWEKNLDSETIAKFQQELADMGYKYQFITLAGIHNMWFNMFELAHSYAQGEGMRHYVEMVQRKEFEAADKGYTFVAHQQEVGTGYFDKMTNTIQGGNSSVTALTGSTEEEQFKTNA
ncbi:isocitrate lyase [Aliivibrio sp. S4TY2]|uniref:isocitrate lyase n=1 Tax=unclassified Aliivibrio TaxID=2645654 RepID=UPI00237848F9|nr:MULTISPECIES: isocitrate lyase [unclassified Aliivibrio]MDD9154900.1 isocitrate lyase [Aliivibrio sp. S4TY2]MDD9158737.1 isocitrate lyase [Aliivibrio sp. S4TY1]MDD9162903.1 isocitrate lyase [Aliivibrio sp. S4MY2]MDD9166736.1 isocitrate lyase [Aliivibrio sp. S4MY4]MDD9183980.1 isocitrate lyase [Aliivibrio sp. S4MY3]